MMRRRKGDAGRGGVSPLGYFCMGFGAIVGVGWAVSINGWILNSGGPIPAAVGYLLVLVMMIPVALCYCELVPMFPKAGGGMCFAYKGFGEKAALVSGWMAFGAFVSIIPWEAIQVTDVLGYLFPALKLGEPLYQVAGSDVYLSSIVIGCGCSGVLLFVNMKGMSTAVSLQKFLCVFLIVAGVIGAAAAAIGGSPDNLMPVYDGAVVPGGGESILGGMLAVLLTAPFFLSGFETIPQGIEEAKGDITKVGKAVVASVALACVFYAGLLLCFGMGIPWEYFCSLDNPAAANLMALMYAGGVTGTVLYWVIVVGAIAGLLTTWNGFFMASANLLMAMSRGGMMPRPFARQTRRGVPGHALLVCFALSVAGPFLGAGLITSITSFSGTAFVLSWLITAASLVSLRKKMPDAPRPYRIPGGAKTGCFAAAVCAIVFVITLVPGSPAYIGPTAVCMLAGWMAIGAVLYASCKEVRRRLPQDLRVIAMFGKDRIADVAEQAVPPVPRVGVVALIATHVRV